jgi:hypothetical protein
MNRPFRGCTTENTESTERREERGERREERGERSGRVVDSVWRAAQKAYVGRLDGLSQEYGEESFKPKARRFTEN